MYIKEDLIIPGDYTFYDLIKTKARGKSGPLFHFDVHEDLRVGLLDSHYLVSDSRLPRVVVAEEDHFRVVFVTGAIEALLLGDFHVVVVVGHWMITG